MDLDGADYGALNDTKAQPVNNADDSYMCGADGGGEPAPL